MLGAVGIYGVIAHFAARRRRDWAIRVALGLPGSRVVAHVVGHGVLLVVAGIGIGVFAAAGAALLGIGLLAAFIPAWRAGRIDPAIALREQ